MRTSAISEQFSLNLTTVYPQVVARTLFSIGFYFVFVNYVTY